LQTELAVISKRADSATAGWAVEKKGRSEDSAKSARKYDSSKRAMAQNTAMIVARLQQIETAKNAHDTAAQSAGWDSLKYELRVTKGALDNLQISGDQHIAILGGEINQRDSFINVQAGFIQRLRSIGDSAVTNNLQKNGQMRQLLNANSKRWIIGPSVTGSYLNGRITPIVGISVTYRLFRF
jgi:hypothetical protein